MRYLTISLRDPSTPLRFAQDERDVGARQLRWQQLRNYETPTENNNGYTTPLLFDHHGKPALLVWGGDHLTAHSAATGELLWSCGGFNPEGTGYWPAIATPVICGDIAVVPVGRDDPYGKFVQILLGGVSGAPRSLAPS